MAEPVLLAENFFNTVQFPSHVIAAEEEASGHEAFRVGNGRRHSLDYWTATTNNSDTWIKVTCDRIRAATCIVIDRGHNLAGKAIRLECSNDDFTTTETPINITLSSVSAAGSVDDALGVRTEEGAWIMRFPVRAARYWRLFVPAMGASLKPQIVGLYLGLSWSPEGFDLPWGDDDDELGGALQESNSGWVGDLRPWNRRAGEMGLEMRSDLEYDQARLNVHGFFRQRSPMWIVYEADQAERAVLAVRPPGVVGLRREEQSGLLRRAVVPWIEHEGKAA